jgi:translation initiation factor 2B subunit (eIF-2B alpha/beta/delta family)
MKLQDILNDKTSGSSQLVLKINKYFYENFNNRSRLKSDLYKIKKQLISFSAVTKYLNRFHKLLNSENESELKRFLTTYQDTFEDIYQIISDKLKKELENKNYFLLLSNSFTLQQVLKYLSREKKFRIVIAESRPKNEGIIFAKELLKLKIRTEIITDAMISNFIQLADAVLIGADQVLKNGNVVNKAGSRNAAIICSYFKKPFYVITSKNKFINKNYFKQVQYNGAEIWNYKDGNLKVVNNYFEEIEKKLITRIITE